MKIREQGILDPHLLRIRFVRPHAVHAYPKHFRVQRLKLLHVVHKARVLACTGWAPVERIEYKHDFLLSRKVRQFHFLLALILQREIRRCFSDRQAHVCFLQSICCRTASYRNTTARANFHLASSGSSTAGPEFRAPVLNLSLPRPSLSWSRLGQLVGHGRLFPETLCRDTLPPERAVFFADASSRILDEGIQSGGRDRTSAGKSQKGLVGCGPL